MHAFSLGIEIKGFKILRSFIPNATDSITRDLTTRVRKWTQEKTNVSLVDPN